MEQRYTEGQTFDRMDFAAAPLPKGEYEGCSFRSCHFSGSDLSGIRFIDCEFVDCDLSNANLKNASLQDVRFGGCKMLGLHFEKCAAFGFSVSFRSCQLSHSSFYGMKLSKTLFADCRLAEVDLTGADLNNSVFDQCDLLNASFENTNLEKADFRTAYNYIIDPELNRIKGARFSLPAVTGLLTKYQIKID